MAKHSMGLSMDEVYRRMVAEARASEGYETRKRGESVTAWGRRARGKLLQVLGIDGKPKKKPPVRIVEQVQCDGYTRHRGYMIAADELAVPFYLLSPDPKPRGKVGLCLAIHGHGPGKAIPVGIATDEEGRKLLAQGDRDYAVQAVKRGWITIAPDLRGFGELMFRQDVAMEWLRSCERAAPRAAQLGKPLMGQRASDIMQFVDYALSRKDIDPRRIVITGNSGGGMMSLFTAAVDRRITAAAPSCYFCSFASSIMAMRHCNCNYVPNLQNVAEMSDIAGLIAPRPLLIIAGTKDPIFPIDAAREGFAKVQKIYAAAGKGDNVELYEGPGSHRYYADRVWDFFAEKLAEKLP